jgi:hypothetical protein
MTFFQKLTVSKTRSSEPIVIINIDEIACLAPNTQGGTTLTMNNGKEIWVEESWSLVVGGMPTDRVAK